MTDTHALPCYLEIEETIGSSSRSIVYRATDTRCGRIVAVKVLRNVSWMSPSELTSFRKHIAEAVTPFASLDVHGYAAVREVGEYDDTLYVERELVEGQSLAEILRAQGPMDLDQAVAVAAPLANVVDALTRRGLKHGAVTLENVFIEGTGSIVLTDGGFSRAASGFRLAGVDCYVGGAHRNVSDLFGIASLVFTLASGYDPILADGDIDRGYHLPTSARNAIYRALGGGRRYRCAGEFMADLRCVRHTRFGGWRPYVRPAAATSALGALVLLGGPVPRIAVSKHAVKAPVAQVTAASSQQGAVQLSPTDMARIRLASRRQGLAILAYPVVADVVGLSEPQREAIAGYLVEQRNRVEAVVNDVALGRVKDSRAAMQEVRETAQMRILGLLDASQRVRWDELTRATGAPGEPVL